ncbi:PHP-associated domain-containing protein [Proteocatella sphenisci]|uniref:PHP-associated domain-containing protein n=1 Tax=Proteocatella sphenisci TaxID=181070 RepID=UPI0004902953|nr:PHP domain-containing protein [Proteocatella sphenisci]
MLIDMHVHEMRNSSDSFMSLEEIVEKAKNIGLDGVCITDHESMGLREYADMYSKKTGFPIFVGAEYLTEEGDILVFGINKLPEKEKLPAQEFIDYVKSEGGVCIAAHPFRNNNRGLGENLKTLKGLSGIEVLNGSTSSEANDIAMRYCTQLGLAPFGASDAHSVMQIGKYATRFFEKISTVSELAEAIKNGRCMPEIRREYLMVENG